MLEYFDIVVGNGKSRTPPLGGDGGVEGETSAPAKGREEKFTFTV